VKNTAENDAQTSALDCMKKISKHVGVRTISKMEPPLRLNPHVKPITPPKTGHFWGDRTAGLREKMKSFG
jgi:hypothetical protein